MAIRTLLIDNYDSYSYNLCQLIAVVNGEAPTVVYNDQLDLPAILADIAQGKYHNVVISPGPGTPSQPEDIGVCVELFESQVNIPILGVCLGHQALAIAYGGRVIPAPEPVHGRLSAIQHNNHPLFNSIPSGIEYQVVRYHSLIVEESSLPLDSLQPIAWTCGSHHALSLINKPESNTFPGDRHTHRDSHIESLEASCLLASSETTSSSGSTSEGGPPLLMGLAHVSLPYYGVQYHPESIATEFGAELLLNFRDITCQHHGVSLEDDLSSSLQNSEQQQQQQQQQQRIGQQACTASATSLGNLSACFAELPGILSSFTGGSEGLFKQVILGHSLESSNSTEVEGTLESAVEASLENTFWLDSATPDRGRFSFMGGPGGELWQRVTYTLPSLTTYSSTTSNRNEASNASRKSSERNSLDCRLLPKGTLTIVDKNGHVVEQRATNFWPWLASELEQRQCSTTTYTVLKTSTIINSTTVKSSSSFKEKAVFETKAGNPTDALPFNFWGGYVGYLGYELKAECGGAAKHPSPTPDAAFFLVDHFLAVDHATGAVYVVALHKEGGESAAQEWVANTVERILSISKSQNENKLAVTSRFVEPSLNGVNTPKISHSPLTEALPQAEALNKQAPIRITAREGRAAYLKNIAACMHALHSGDSYEICLTTALSTDQVIHPWSLYQVLRRINPAPYAAWFNMGPIAPSHGCEGRKLENEVLESALTVCCSSPERFLRGSQDGSLEAKPIKGTARRVLGDAKADEAAAAALQGSEKDRAENLMIVDLLRNDLGRVCEVGSVHVPGLMQIESFATVHQLVSTVLGQRRANASVVDAIRAAFPGGSMTGAPKVRTMSIIDSLEQGPRGVYSGSLGYISFNGAFDLNIVIRSAVFWGGRCSIGAGGAIVAQSDPDGEWEEMKLKCAALLRALEESQREVVLECGE